MNKDSAMNKERAMKKRYLVIFITMPFVFYLAEYQWDFFISTAPGFLIPGWRLKTILTYILTYFLRGVVLFAIMYAVPKIHVSKGFVILSGAMALLLFILAWFNPFSAVLLQLDFLLLAYGYPAFMLLWPLYACIFVMTLIRWRRQKKSV